MTNKVKALCVATRCADVDDFVTTFHRYCDADAFFVATMTMRPVGLETPFAIQLQDKTPVLRGMCVVREAWTSADNPFGRPGIWLGIRRLTRESTDVFAKLRARRAGATPPARAAGVPSPPGSNADRAPTPPPLPVTAFAKPKTKTVQIPVIVSKRPNASATGTSASKAIPHDDVATALGSSPLTAIEAPREPSEARLALSSQSETTAPAPHEGPPARPETDVPTMVRDRTATDSSTVTTVRAESSSSSSPGETSDAPKRAEAEQRVPGSDYVLPANPLMNLTDESLEGFIDCTLYEETAQFVFDELTPLPRQPVELAPLESPIEPPPPAPDEPPPTRAPEPQIQVVPPEPVAIPEPVAPPIVAAPIEVPVVAPVVAPPPLPPEIPAFAAPVVTPVPMRVEPLRMEPNGPRRRWWLIAAPLAAVAVALALVIVSRSSSSATTTPGGPPRKPAVVAAARPAPERTADPADRDPPKAVDVARPAPEKAARVAPPDPEESEPVREGSPVVGKGPCRIAIAATPADSQIIVDGQTVGPAPLALDTTCARHKVDVSHPRYAATTRLVAPTEGKPANLDVTLARPTHHLTVATQPANATVSINGRRAGTSPTVVSIMGFQSISITVQKPGYKTVTKRVYSRKAIDRTYVVLPRTGGGFFGGKR